MDKNEFVAWVSKNTGSGGQRPTSDPFNRSKKGKERLPRAEEYPMKDIKERHSYYERNSQKRADEDREQEKQFQNSSNKQDQTSKRQKKNSNRARNASQNGVNSFIRNTISRVALVVAGSVIVVGGYQAMEEQRRLENLPPVVETVDWHWEDDFSGATVDLLDDKGEIILTVDAEVSVYTKEPSCKEEGLITYTAKVLYDEKEYTDLKTKSLEIISHKFDEGHVIQLDDGSYAIVYECQICHETFSIQISLEEE